MSDLPSAAEFGRLSVHLAEGAAEVVRDGRTGRAALEVSHKTTDTDLVTQIDHRTEAWLRDEIARLRPGDAVLGEEAGDRTGSTGVRWVVDPIDGTVNFVLGIPHYAVSVAVEVDGSVVAGAVCDVALGETFRAVRGEGAFVGDVRLHGPRDVPLAQAVIGTGFGYDAGLRERQAAAAAVMLPQIANLRRLGSAALDLCYVAAGRLDGYFEVGLNQWDHAAGALIVAEAGCMLAGRHDEPLSSRLVVAAGPGLIDDLRALLASTGADEAHESAGR